MMPNTPQSKARDVMRQLDVARDYVAELVQNASVPLTREDMEEAISSFRKMLEANQGAANALVLAAWQDQPCPISLFKPWASYSVIRSWSMASQDPLMTSHFNGKLCVRPSDFFRAFNLHGKKRQIQG